MHVTSQVCPGRREYLGTKLHPTYVRIKSTNNYYSAIFLQLFTHSSVLALFLILGMTKARNTPRKMRNTFHLRSVQPIGGE